MSTSFVTYVVSGGGGDHALSILLDDRRGRPTGELLRELHGAARTWAQSDPAARLRPSIDDNRRPGAVERELRDYLFGDGTFNRDRLARNLTELRRRGSIHRFVPRVGAPVEGADLVGREAEIEALLGRADAGSCHFRAPRRYGKTSLLRELERRMIEHGRSVFFADVSSEESPTGFFTTLALAAMDRAGSRAALDGMPALAGWPPPGASPEDRSAARKDLASCIAADPIAFGRTLLSRLAAGGVVMILDEFSQFLRTARQKNEEGARAILEELSGCRRSEPASHQVVAGSAGLSSYTRFWGLGQYLEDLQPVDLHPPQARDERILAEELLYGSAMAPTPAVIDRIVTESGGSTLYYIQSLCDAVRAEAGPARELTDPEVVTRAYRGRLLGPVGNHLFRVYHLNNQPYPEQLRKGAAAVLRRLASHDDGAAVDELREGFSTAGGEVELFEPLLLCMSEDYDLVESPGRWKMRSKVLREKWAVAGAGMTEER